MDIKEVNNKMSYYGFDEDEDECTGYCGNWLCPDCRNRMEQQGDQDYEAERQREIDAE